MAGTPTQTTPVPADAEAPVAASAPSAGTARRTVTLPVLPLAIVGAALGALILFGGGVAVGFAVGHHPERAGIIQPFTNGRTGPFGGQNGFGQNGGQPGGRNGGFDGGFNGGQNGPQPGDQGSRPTPAPTNG